MARAHTRDIHINPPPPKRNLRAKNKWDEVIFPNLDLIEHYLCDGWNQNQICEWMDISPTTLSTNANKHPELREILNSSKVRQLAKLEKTAYQKALEGDNTMMIFFLKALNPHKFADRMRNDNVNHNVTEVNEPSPEECKKWAKEILKESE